MATLTREQYRKRKRRKKKMMKYGILLGFALILVLILLLIIKIFTLIFSSHDDGIVEKVGSIKVNQSLLTESEYSRPGTPIESVKNIVIHSTGIKGLTAQERRDTYESHKDTKNVTESVHFIIGLDGKILQLIPTNEVSCSSQKYNSNSIAIEFCESGADGAMSKETYASLTTLVAYLCDVYKIDTDHVILHYDITSAMCPRLFVQNQQAWKDFLANVNLAKKGKNYDIKSGVVDENAAPNEEQKKTEDAPTTEASPATEEGGSEEASTEEAPVDDAV